MNHEDFPYEYWAPNLQKWVKTDITTFEKDPAYKDQQYWMDTIGFYSHEGYTIRKSR